jgi:SWIRM domain
MADKVALQPSTKFDADSTSSSTSTSVIGLNFSSTSTSQSIIPKHFDLNRPHEMESRPQLLPVSSLISPPEPSPYESFSQPSAAPTMATPVKQAFLKPPTQFPSPPVSPETRTGHEDRSTPTVKDPILYPPQDNASVTSSQPPLFVDEDEILANRVVDEHLTARSLTPQFREASPPRREDYKLALEFKSQVAMLCNQNPRQWLIREREYLLEDQRRRRAFAKIAPAPAYPSKTTKNTIARVSKPKTPRAPRAPRATPPDRARQVYGSMTPEPGRRHNVGSTREDKNFDLLPDYSPPLSTLPNRPNSLKVEWKGAPIDLRDDPHRNLLHEDELSLAANLRLDCATYLTSKRRIFMARLECLKIGKEFRKTDSQQACKIDVNKASKLWAAFDKVGWLKAEYVARYL